ncbi:MAG: GNAT family N-acetyltransferase, partial [Nitrospirales bacterium]
MRNKRGTRPCHTAAGTWARNNNKREASTDSAAAASPQVRLRPAAPDDLPGLCDLEAACFPGYYAPHRLTPRHFVALLRSPHRLCILALRNATLLGYVSGTVLPSSQSAARVDSLAVMPEARGQGVGSRLLDHFLHTAMLRGCRQVRLEVAIPNQTGLRFFQQRGFSPIRRLTDYYSPQVDGLLMYLTLNGPQRHARPGFATPSS